MFGFWRKSLMPPVEQELFPKFFPRECSLLITRLRQCLLRFPVSYRQLGLSAIEFPPLEGNNPRLLLTLTIYVLQFRGIDIYLTDTPLPNNGKFNPTRKNNRNTTRHRYCSNHIRIRSTEAAGSKFYRIVSLSFGKNPFIHGKSGEKAF